MMEVVNKKRRKVSMKKKRSWRKHIDTKDVDSFLENERLEERLGAPFTKRSDNDLFVVDTMKEEPADKGLTTEKEKRRSLLKSQELRCLAVLKPHTAVPDPIAKRNRVKSLEERKNPITRRLERERKLVGDLKLKEKLAAKNKEFTAARRLDKPKRGEFNSDVWNENKKAVIPGVDNQWLTSDTTRHTLANQGVRKRKIPTSVLKKPSEIPALDVPHPGTSYNPSYDDHQDLLRQVVKKEMKLMKEEAHLNRVTNKMFQKVSIEQRDKIWLQESSEGLPLNQKAKKLVKETENEENSIVKSVNPPVKNVKKTLIQKRKQKEQRKLALRLKHNKIEKKKISDIYKLEALKKHITTKEKKLQALREKRHKIKEIKAREPKTLSKVKFEPLELDFKLSEELSGNLRNSNPTGNLLMDRFKSFQQRNIVAPSKRVLKLNKANVKRFVKPDHKMDWEK
ncbi:ribosome biogenesis protein NOP53 [Venturia canescens]|uniref:ribosome biogenesis protein NOP53 n=1 Tax=Venturia canescens TaxID=32260 RepID=UPI001C9C1A9A|nr:ribosome biogenesis protein NOP53 [Venturia canescens]